MDEKGNRMEQIIRTFGRFILDAVALMAVFALIFTNMTDEEGNRGIINILGAHMQTPSIEYVSYTDFDKYSQEAAKSSPRIECNALQMTVGTNQVGDFLTATSSSGASLEVEVMDITDIAGNSYMANYDESSNTVTLSAQGVYTFRVCSVDEINQRSIVDINIPVTKP